MDDFAEMLKDEDKWFMSDSHKSSNIFISSYQKYLVFSVHVRICLDVVLFISLCPFYALLS